MKPLSYFFLFFVVLFSFQCAIENLDPVSEEYGAQDEYIQFSADGNHYYDESFYDYRDGITSADSLTTITIHKTTARGVNSGESVKLLLSTEEALSDWTFPMLFDANPATSSDNKVDLFRGEYFFNANSTFSISLRCIDSLNVETPGCDFQLWIRSYDEAEQRIVGDFSGIVNDVYYCPLPYCAPEEQHREISGSFSILVDR